jgi:hypothetical protein
MPTNPKPKSSKKSATARANGAKSHGPVTAAGRARSSRNATRHGLSTCGAARRPGAVRDAALPTVSVVLGDESIPDFHCLLNSYLDEFAPTSPIEVELVETMASARWRLRRLANIETTLLANEIQTTVNHVDRVFADLDFEPGAEDRLACAFKSLAYGPSLHLLNRYEGTINRSYAQAFKQLHLLRSLRIRAQPNEPRKSLQSLPVEPLGDRAAPHLKTAPARNSPVEPSRRPGSIPLNKDDRTPRPRPPVLQTPPQSPKIHTELLQIPALPTQRATIEVSPRINDQHLHS